MIKARFGDSVRSKSDTSMTNKHLRKILYYNISICLLI
jgi:uncharacterized phage-associated protein